MKSFTDIKQSKKLAEILPNDSADMCYRIVSYNPNDTHKYQPYCFVKTLESDILCWSLAALLDYLAKKDCFPEVTYTGTCYLMDVNFYDDEEGKLIHPIHFIRTEGESLVDVIVEMILKLHEEKLL